MKHAVGIVLLVFGHLLNGLILLAAIIYAFGMITWMHAPIVGVLEIIAIAAMVPLAVAWGCRAAGRAAMSSMVAGERQPRNIPLAPVSPLKKQFRIGAGVVVTVAGIVLICYAYTDFECVTDRSRFTLAAEAQALKNGFTRVCRSDLSRYHISFGSLDRAIHKLAFTPVDLRHTPFAAFRSRGGSVESINDIPARLYRGFLMPDGHRLTLSEHDMSADGVRMYRRPEDEPERINELRARLNVMEVKPGQAISHLSWVEGRRSYELWVDANVAREPLRTQLFALAASLPKSVPACPNEPKQTRTEWDRLTARPSVMPTREEFEQMNHSSTRPCR